MGSKRKPFQLEHHFQTFKTAAKETVRRTKSEFLNLIPESSNSKPGKSSTVNLQPSSSFFKLPEEIRQQIYREIFISYGPVVHVFPGDQVHVPDRQLIHMRCLNSKHFLECGYCCADPSSLLYRENVCSNGHLVSLDCMEMASIVLQTSRKKGNMLLLKMKSRLNAFKADSLGPYLSVLLTCKLIYMGAIEVLYQSTHFTFSGPSALNRFLEAAPAHCIRSIPSITLHYPVFWTFHLGNVICPTCRVHISKCHHVSEAEGFYPMMNNELSQLGENASKIGILKRLRIDLTVTHNQMTMEEFVTPLTLIQANDFVIETWSFFLKDWDKSKEFPFRLKIRDDHGP